MQSKYRNKDWIRKYKFQLILSLCLIAAPFIIYLHLIFEPYQRSIEFLGYYIEIESFSFQALAWILLTDASSIIILLVLFFSISYKWKYALFLPVIIYLDSFFRHLSKTNDILISFPHLKYFTIGGIIILLLVMDYQVLRRYRIQVLNLKLTHLIRESSTNKLSEIKEIIKSNSELDKKNNSKLLQTLYNIKLHFDKLLKEVNRVNFSELMGSNIRISIMATSLIIFSLSLWLLHYFIPKGAITYDLGFFTIKAHGYNDVQVFIWVISRKVMVIIPMIIWFITYHSWWRFAILSPLILYLFQFWEAIQDGYSNVDAYGNYKVFPLVLFSIILLLAISRIVRRHSYSLDIYEQINSEIDQLINKLGEERSGVGDYRNRFEQIRSKLVKDSGNKTNLGELTQLQQELQNKGIS